MNVYSIAQYKRVVRDCKETGNTKYTTNNVGKHNLQLAITFANTHCVKNSNGSSIIVQEGTSFTRSMKHVFPVTNVTSKEHIIWTVKTLSGITNNSSLTKVTARNYHNTFSALNSMDC